MNNLVYFWDYSGWAYNCDSFLGYCGITFYFLRTVLIGAVSGWVYNCNSFLGCWVNYLVYFWLVSNSFLGY